MYNKTVVGTALGTGPCEGFSPANLAINFNIGINTNLAITQDVLLVFCPSHETIPYTSTSKASLSRLRDP